ncbi:hypothetical protein SNEBB_000383 [Seison nebaliae]|nr:hypothetical protein SNEBB_000383 [Seison nebaliae]
MENLIDEMLKNTNVYELNSYRQRIIFEKIIQINHFSIDQEEYSYKLISYFLAIDLYLKKYKFASVSIDNNSTNYKLPDNWDRHIKQSTIHGNYQSNNVPQATFNMMLTLLNDKIIIILSFGEKKKNYKDFSIDIDDCSHELFVEKSICLKFFNDHLQLFINEINNINNIHTLTLQELPDLIIYEILEHLPGRDVEKLRKTCRNFSRLFPYHSHVCNNDRKRKAFESEFNPINNIHLDKFNYGKDGSDSFWKEEKIYFNQLRKFDDLESVRRKRILKLAELAEHYRICGYG